MAKNRQVLEYQRFAAHTAQRMGIPVALFFGLIQQESGWRQDAGSSAGAIGLTQKMPFGNAKYNERLRTDWKFNIVQGAKEFASAWHKYKKPDLALAAYNAGDGAVQKYGGVPPYAETRAYIPRVMQYAHGYKKQMPALMRQFGLGSGPLNVPQGQASAIRKNLRQQPQPDLSAVTAFLSAQQAVGGADMGSPMVPRFPKSSALLQSTASNVTPIGQLTARIASAPHEDIPTPMMPNPLLSMGQSPLSLGDIGPKPGKTIGRIGPQGIPVIDEVHSGKIPPKIQKIVSQAHQYLGTPYKWGGTTPKGFDCSGFVQYLYAQQGISIPRTTYQQIHAGKAVHKIKDLQPGDIILFGSAKDPHHEGMYIGHNQFIQAPHTGDVVKISSLKDPYYRQHFVTGRRIVGSGGGGKRKKNRR